MIANLYAEEGLEKPKKRCRTGFKIPPAMLKSFSTGVLLIGLQLPVTAQPHLILDTDFGGDADDLGALAMLHHFIDRNECSLLAIMSWSAETYTVSAIDAVNRYYGHPNIPIGTRNGETSNVDWNYNKTLTDQLPFQLHHHMVPDATALYRKLLSSADDHSITLVAIGPLLNIQNLINSPPDTLSPLTGKELIARKIKECVIMGGNYPRGKWEWNFNGNMRGVTQYVLENLHMPVVFSGYELGKKLQAGKTIQNLDSKTPLFIGYNHFNRHAPWMRYKYRGHIENSSSFDQSAVLYAVRNGEGLYWKKINGCCLPNESGGNRWIRKKHANHSYLKLRMNPNKLASLIESMMLGEF